MANVQMKKVCKSYGDLRVIEDLDLDVRDGELVVLAGPPGCGKSTALRMLAGLEEITGGEVTIGDRVVHDVPPEERDVAMVFRNYALYPHMSVRENLEFGLRIRKTGEDEIGRRVAEAAELLGLPSLLDRKPRQLSGGQQLRVAVGRAIAREPSALLFDEPLSNLDAKLRAEMRAEISKLQRRLEVTTLYVTSDPVEAMAIGHRIAIMKDGALEQAGTPLEVYESPQSVFVASFIATPPSFFNATLAGATLRHPAFEIPLPDAWRGAAAPHEGRDVTAGIRPENLLADAGTGRGPTAGLTVEVESVEPLGHEVLVHGRVGDDVVVAKADPHRMPKVGEPLDLILELDHLHLFDPASERRLGG